MPFVLPTFNVPVNVWHSRDLSFPPVGPPDIAALLVNWSLGRRIVLGTDATSLAFRWAAGNGIDVLIRVLMAPAGTDIRGPGQDGVNHFGDAVEVPAGSGAFYWTLDVADMGKGFSNEHRFVWCAPSFFVALPSPLP